MVFAGVALLAQGKAGAEKAINLLRSLPRVEMNNIKPLPGQIRKIRVRRGDKAKGGKCGRGDKGQGQYNTLNRLGYEGGQTPFYLRIPKEPYYMGHHVRRQYPPLSLLEIQRLVDLGRLDVSQPVDLTALRNPNIFSLDPLGQKHSGVNLTDDGVDIFCAPLNIEVQFASESVIAAVERAGGVITTRYFDPISLQALVNPVKWLQQGEPIPRCKLPPEDILDYYTSTENRGYLADPEKVAEARAHTAQKYGYSLPDLAAGPLADLMRMRKDPRQIWHGLEPGWLVNLKDKCVLKPIDSELTDYYHE